MQNKSIVVYTIIIMFLVCGAAYGKSKETSDIWIESHLVATYTLNEHLNPFDIEVGVDKGRVTLTGMVDTAVQKGLAGEIAKGMEGVKEVDNKLRLDPPAGKKDRGSDFLNMVNDASLTARVKSNLLWNRETKGMDINVETNNGVVTLKGTLASDAQKELAGRIAENTKGVKSVENDIRIDPNAETAQQSVKSEMKETTESVSGAVNDAWITVKVKNTLLFNKNLSVFGISVSTENGVVTISGKVDKESTKDYAKEVVTNVEGVKKVENRIQVTS